VAAAAPAFGSLRLHARAVKQVLRGRTELLGGVTADRRLSSQPDPGVDAVAVGDYTAGKVAEIG
jgi:hypothetical protein